MADELIEVLRLHLYKEVRDCLVSHSQANLHASCLMIHQVCNYMRLDIGQLPYASKDL